MLESGFRQNPLSWLLPSLGTVDDIKPIDASPPDLKDEMCGPHRKRMLQAEEDDEEAGAASADNDTNTSAGDAADGGPKFSVLLSALRAPSAKNANLLPDAGPVVPIVVYTGPTRPPGWKPAPVRKRVVTAAVKPAAPKAKPHPKPTAAAPKPAS